jgi:hypothetical protein
MHPSPYGHPPISESSPTYLPPNAPGITGDNTGGVIPFKNPQALISYYVGLFSLIPVFGLFMGPAAVILGVLGLKYAKRHPIVKGQVHAWVGIVCGGFWTIVYWGLLFAMVMAFGRANLR